MSVFPHWLRLQAENPLRLQAGAAWYAAELAQRTGRIADAENEARLALDLTPDDVNLFTGGAVELLDTDSGVINLIDQDGRMHIRAVHNLPGVLVGREIEAGEGWETDGEAHDHGDVTLLDYQKAQERDVAEERLFDE